VTAIHHAAEDGNAATEADPTWQPLAAPGGSAPDFTPPFPAYISGHATFGAASMEAIKDYYGTDQIAFTLSSDEVPGVTRSYQSLSQAIQENGDSRVYMGVHWHFDCAQGIAVGRNIADYTIANVMTKR
jgi:hypothetical protein